MLRVVCYVAVLPIPWSDTLVFTSVQTLGTVGLPWASPVKVEHVSSPCLGNTIELYGLQSLFGVTRCSARVAGSAETGPALS